MEVLTGFKSWQQSNAANGSAPAWPSLTHSYPLQYCLCILILKMLFLPFLSIQNTEKILLSLYYHQIIRALGTSFIG
jgi:hypothetical protein